MLHWRMKIKQLPLRFIWLRTSSDFKSPPVNCLVCVSAWSLWVLPCSVNNTENLAWLLGSVALFKMAVSFFQFNETFAVILLRVQPTKRANLKVRGKETKKQQSANGFKKGQFPLIFANCWSIPSPSGRAETIQDICLCYKYRVNPPSVWLGFLPGSLAVLGHQGGGSRSREQY